MFNQFEEKEMRTYPKNDIISIGCNNIHGAEQTNLPTAINAVTCQGSIV